VSPCKNLSAGFLHPYISLACMSGQADFASDRVRVSVTELKFVNVEIRSS